VISVVGTVAMLWVGGHILLVNVHEVGWWDAPYNWVHDLEHDVEHAVHGFLGATLAWLVNTGISAVIGLIVGAVVVAVVSVLPFGGDKDVLEPEHSVPDDSPGGEPRL
jgi:predicted DNA repair protein MutK